MHASTNKQVLRALRHVMKYGLSDKKDSKLDDIKLKVPKIAEERNCDHLINRYECDFRKTISDIVQGFPHTQNV